MARLTQQASIASTHFTCLTRSFVAVGAALSVAATSAQTPTMVADLATQSSSQIVASNPRSPYVLPDGSVLFAAGNYEGSRQGVLFRTDGTPQGTRLVDTSLDVRCGGAHAAPWSEGSGDLCFFNDSGEVWRTDGTSRGTWLLTDLASASALPSRPAPTGEVVIAPPGASSIVTTADGRVYWLTSSVGTVGLVGAWSGLPGSAEVITRAISVYPALTGWGLAPLGNGVVFANATAAGNFEPWIADQSSTRPLAEINPGNAPSNPRWFRAFAGRVYFVATDASGGTELWRTDGTQNGTVRVADLAPGSASSDPEFLTVSGGRLWFSATTPGFGRRFWHTDGSGAPQAVAGLAVLSQAQGLLAPVAFAGGVTHASSVAAGSALHLVRTSGVVQLTPADGSIVQVGTTRAPVAVAASGPTPARLYFNGQFSTPGIGQELFFAEAATESATLAADIATGPASSLPGPLAPLPGGRLLLASTVNADRELYVSDGTATGTRLLRNIHEVVPSGNPTRAIAGEGPGQVVFSSDSTQWGAELFQTSASGSAPAPLVEVIPGAAGRRREVFRAASTWFSLYEGSSSTTRDVFQHDSLASVGGAIGTIKNVLLSRPIHIVGDNVLCTANNPGTTWPFNPTLWGASEAYVAQPLLNVDDGGPSDTSPIFHFAGQNYFTGDAAPGSSVDRRIYLTDGTTLGTQPILDLGIASQGGGLAQIIGAIANNIIFSFSAAPESGIFAFSPETEQATLLAPGYVPLRDSRTPDACTVGDKLFFAATIADGDFELFVSSGTAPGTRQLLDIASGPEASAPSDFFAGSTLLGTRAFFSAWTPARGREVWISDGSAQGTTLLLDIFPGSRSASPSGFFQIEPGVVGFIADDGVSGAELWRTDGTPQGTRMVADLNPGPEPSAPTNIVVLVNRVWFSAFTRQQGRELWVMPTGAVSLCDYDFNQDENVDLLDAQEMALVAAGLINSEDSWLTGDLNRDENADLADAQILAGYLATGICPV